MTDARQICTCGVHGAGDCWVHNLEEELDPRDTVPDWKARAEKAEADSRVLREALTRIKYIAECGNTDKNWKMVWQTADAALSSCPSGDNNG